MKGGARLTDVYRRAVSNVSEVKRFTGEMLEYISRKSDGMKPATEMTDEDIRSMRNLSSALFEAIERAENGESSHIRVPLTRNVQNFTMELLGPIFQRSLVTKMVLVHLISLLEEFIQDYVLELLVAHPVMLRSKAQISFEELSTYKSIKQLHRGLAAREVGVFAHQGVEEVADFFLKRMNINLATFTGWDALRENSYRRNTISHNGARIDETYREKMRVLHIADIPELNEDYVNEAATRILNFQKFLHAEVKRKFG